MLDDLLGNPARLPAHARGVQTDGTVETRPLRRWRWWWRRFPSTVVARVSSPPIAASPTLAVTAFPLPVLLFLELLLRGHRVDEQAVQVVFRNVDVLAGAQTAVAFGGFVVALGEGERVLPPTEQSNAVPDRPDKDPGVAQARQVQVPGEILGELLHQHVVVPPQRHLVQVLAQDGVPGPYGRPTRCSVGSTARPAENSRP